MSESGIHRPHVAGISGREGDGAYSIVLSGGYEDDQVCLCPSHTSLTLSVLFYYGVKIVVAQTTAYSMVGAKIGILLHSELSQYSV